MIDAETLDLTLKSIFLILGFYVTYQGYMWKKRKDRMEIIEKSYIEMQKFNETVLANKDSLKAAIMAVNPDREYDDEKARISYINLMRINRLYRVWLYAKEKFITENERDIIINSHARTLKSIDSIELSALLQRGYTPDFGSYLKIMLDNLEVADPLF